MALARILLRVLLMSAALLFVFPVVTSVVFHGTIPEALLLAAIVTAVNAGLFLVFDASERGINALVRTRLSFVLALVVLVPTWILGFWVLPGLVLLAASLVVPQLLTVGGVGGIIGSGFITYLITYATNGYSYKRKASRCGNGPGQKCRGKKTSGCDSKSDS